MAVELRPLTHADISAHNAGEDSETIRWLTGARGTLESTRTQFELLAANAEAGKGKRGFGVWHEGRLAGYVDFDPDVADGLDPDEVNISYAVHPWARGRGVAADAVLAVCEVLRSEGIGRRAGIRVEPDNLASVRVADKCGFQHRREVVSSTDTHDEGSPARLRVYLLDL